MSSTPSDAGEDAGGATVYQNDDPSYAIVNNIPKDYHSADLRNFFSQMIETGCFKCFHYRHRPELKRTAASASEGEVDSGSRLTESEVGTGSRLNEGSSSRCCVVMLTRENLQRFVKTYHRKHWLKKNGEPMSQRCFIAEVNRPADSSDILRNAKDKSIPADREVFTGADLADLPELHPPAVMPNGNVGTPTSVFHALIRDCRLPTSVIAKLGLVFPATKRNRKYTSVPFEYRGTSVALSAADETVMSGDGHVISDVIGEVKVKVDDGPGTSPQRRVEEDASRSGSDDDDDTCEEWERHQALHDDEFDRSRNKERVYEEKIELKWEKGGSGLVFYTDSYRWKQEEGDFDEQTADDWDVDMSAYYDPDPNAGDKDARDYLDVRLNERRRHADCADDHATFSGKIGKFEQHTKGIGRKVLERQGWTEGSGLGMSREGMAEALDNDGQPSHIKTGLGYRGEKLNRYGTAKKKAMKEVVISTVYDEPSQLAESESLYRRNGELFNQMTYHRDAYGLTSSTGGKKFVRAKENGND